MIDPIAVACPQCGAEAGTRCWSGMRRGQYLARGSHAPRTRRARGENVPDSFSTFLRREIHRAAEDVVSRKKKR